MHKLILMFNIQQKADAKASAFEFLKHHEISARGILAKQIAKMALECMFRDFDALQKRTQHNFIILFIKFSLIKHHSNCFTQVRYSMCFREHIVDI